MFGVSRVSRISISVCISFFSMFGQFLRLVVFLHFESSLRHNQRIALGFDMMPPFQIEVDSISSTDQLPRGSRPKSHTKAKELRLGFS